MVGCDRPALLPSPQPHGHRFSRERMPARHATATDGGDRADGRSSSEGNRRAQGRDGPSERPIYGGRGAFVGRLQFSVQTVISYQRKRDGTVLNRQEALDLAHDYDRAAALAKYMIFELEEPFHWPLCSRKIGLRNEMAAIKEMTNQAALAR